MTDHPMAAEACTELGADDVRSSLQMLTYVLISAAALAFAALLAALA